MKIAIYTYDLCPGREYLMPWRTILEVAKVMTHEKHEVLVLNACYDESIRKDYEWQSVAIKALQIGFDVLAKELVAWDADAVFVPFSWRDGLKDLSILNHVGCKKIAYMAGGVYDLKSAWTLLKNSGKSWAKPYLLESLVPKKRFVKSIKAAGLGVLIGLTDVTVDSARKAGFGRAVAIYPGNDGFKDIEPDDSVVAKYGLKGKKWLLFSGAPAAYRGAEMLLQAVDKVKDDSIRLVMLMRTDVGSQYEIFEDALAKMKHPERVQIIKEKVTREQLRAFFGEAWYALLPFIVIPSEVPLTYFELLSCGTPVITFKNGGTTEYLKDGLLVADKSVKGLAKALNEAWADKEKRERLSINGSKIMAAHPTWKEVGKEWVKLLK